MKDLVSKPVVQQVGLYPIGIAMGVIANKAIAAKYGTQGMEFEGAVTGTCLWALWRGADIAKMLLARFAPVK